MDLSVRGALSCMACGEPVEPAWLCCENCGKVVTAPVRAERQELAPWGASATHPGRIHAQNQDAIGLRAGPWGMAFALADGVSTAWQSARAAELAVATVLDHLERPSSGPTDEHLRDAILAADQAIADMPYPDPADGLAEPQATVVAGLIAGDQLSFGWVGDSRLYVLGPNPRQITVDDSWLNQQLAAGMSLATAMASPDAHCITQCLGMRDDEACVHIGRLSLVPGERLLVCSDGLWNYMPSAEMLNEMVLRALAGDGPSKACEALVQFANEQGGHDNITVGLVMPPACRVEMRED